MNNLKKTLALVAALAMTTSVFVGCGDDESKSEGTTTTSAADGTSGTAAEDPGTDLNLKTDGKELLCWGWNDEFVNRMMENHYLKDNPLPDGITYTGHNQGDSNTYQSQIDVSLGAGDKIDLYVIEGGYAPAYIDSNWTTPLKDIGIAEADIKASQYSYTVDIATDKDGVIKGASWQAAPGGYCYRADLAESLLGITSPADMQTAVDDWDKFLETAKKLKEKSGGKTKICTAIGDIWNVFSATRGNAWVEDKTLKVTEDLKKFMDTAKTMKTENYVDFTIDQWSDAWFLAGRTDNTMGYFVSTWGIGNSIMMKACGKDAIKSQADIDKMKPEEKEKLTADQIAALTGTGTGTYGKWALCEGPQAYYWGGTWIVVGPNCDNQDLAAKVIRYFTLDEASMKNYALTENDYVNNDKVMNEIVSEGHKNELFKDGVSQFTQFSVAAKNIKELKITGYDQDLNNIFKDAYTKYANNESGYGSYDEAMKEFGKSVKNKFAELDVKEATKE